MQASLLSAVAAVVHGLVCDRAGACFAATVIGKCFGGCSAFAAERHAGSLDTVRGEEELGVAPLRRLAEAVIELLAAGHAAIAFYAGMRLMAVDSFVVDVPDTPANERAFGRPAERSSPGAFRKHASSVCARSARTCCGVR